MREQRTPLNVRSTKFKRVFPHYFLTVLLIATSRKYRSKFSIFNQPIIVQIIACLLIFDAIVFLLFIFFFIKTRWETVGGDVPQPKH